MLSHKGTLALRMVSWCHIIPSETRCKVTGTSLSGKTICVLQMTAGEGIPKIPQKRVNEASGWILRVKEGFSGG